MKEDSEAVQSWRAALGSAAAEAPPGASCPAPERVWTAAGGELGRSETLAVLDHATGCPACSLVWQLATQLRSQTVGVQVTEVAAPARPGRRWRWGLAAAATLAAALVGLRIWPLLQPEVQSHFRQPAEAAIRSLLGDEQALPRESCLLRWSTGLPGTTYSIQVASQNLQVVARARGLEQPEFRVPPDALAELASGSRLLWRVEAFLPDGRRLSSPTFVNRLE